MKKHKESTWYKNLIKMGTIIGLSFVMWLLWTNYACDYFEIKKPDFMVVVTLMVTFNYIKNKIKGENPSNS